MRAGVDGAARAGGPGCWWPCTTRWCWARRWTCLCAGRRTARGRRGSPSTCSHGATGLARAPGGAAGGAGAAGPRLAAARGCSGWPWRSRRGPGPGQACGCRRRRRWRGCCWPASAVTDDVAVPRTPAAPARPPRLVLASASPARLRLLRDAGLAPDVVVSGVDEDAVTAPDPAALVAALARAKARWRSRAVLTGDDGHRGGGLRLAARPRRRGAGQARRHRRGAPTLAVDGRPTRARCATGHCVLRVLGGEVQEPPAVEVASTVVQFGRPDADELEAYLRTGEPLAVAGAFTLDGYAAPFVEAVEGNAGTVVGLSLPTLRRLLRPGGRPAHGPVGALPRAQPGAQPGPGAREPRVQREPLDLVEGHPLQGQRLGVGRNERQAAGRDAPARWCSPSPPWSSRKVPSTATVRRVQADLLGALAQRGGHRVLGASPRRRRGCPRCRRCGSTRRGAASAGARRGAANSPAAPKRPQCRWPGPAADPAVAVAAPPGTPQGGRPHRPARPASCVIVLSRGSRAGPASATGDGACSWWPSRSDGSARGSARSPCRSRRGCAAGRR